MSQIAHRVTLGILMMVWSLAAALPLQSRAGEPAVPSRVLERIDDGRLTALAGNTHPATRWSDDEGPVAPALAMQGMRLVLRRSAAQEAALQLLMQQQLDARSPNYHRWLSPAEFGTTFGPSDDDIQAVDRWLASQGFEVEGANAGRTFIQFSGTAAQVEQAFHTEIHRFVVGGIRHVANIADPSIPTALQPVVAGIGALHDFRARPLHHDLGAVVRDVHTGKWIPESPTRAAKTLFGVAGNPGLELLSPYDFAAIYNVAPLWNAGIDGTGQSIAIAGRSDINLADVAAFRAAFRLPPKVPSVIVNGSDPGIPSAGDKMENTLDVEWSGAVAKGANIVFVTTASNLSDGAASSALYIIDNLLAPVMSFSYGACEMDLGTGGNAAYNALWQQAAAEGISVFVASGDQGAAACDSGGTPPYGAANGLAVSGTSSTPFNVAVGGTDFNWINVPSTSFWTGSNATTGASAVGYIPEIPWNSTCASLAVDVAVGAAAAGLDQEQTCQAMISQNVDLFLVGVTGGTGGVSNCTAPISSTAAGCRGGYAKPSWQAGTGVPQDGHRDVPDVALFAASGALGTAYVICDSDAAPCNYGVANDAVAQAVGGTSVAAPAFAGLMALVNQQTRSPQGNANAHLYALAALDNRATCNSVSVRAGNTCNFYDVTTDSNAVPCAPGSPNCQLHHAGDRVGILTGYVSTTGYDLATGLGTVNAYNLVNNWHVVGSAGSAVTIPNVVGATQSAASAALAAAGLTVGSLTQQSSSTVAAGVVISESPAAGTSVAAKSAVSLVVSSGPPPVKVPNVVGATQAAASATLTTAGLAVGTVTQKSSSTVAVGVVISESPAAGASVAAKSAVSLVVSSGPLPVKVPNVVGSTQSVAANSLSAAGLVVGTVTTQSNSSVAKGKVVSESPASGSSVPTGSKVNLVVSG